jgi:hypothetical protein
MSPQGGGTVALQVLARAVVGGIDEFQLTFDRAFGKLLRAHGLAPPPALLPEAGPAPSRQEPPRPPKVPGSAPSARSGELVRLLEAERASIQKVLGRFRIPAPDRDDVVQETCLLFLLNERELAQPAAWFLASLGYRCRAHWRDHSRRQRRLRLAPPETLELLAARQAP